jgi:hypothetical protein
VQNVGANFGATIVSFELIVANMVWHCYLARDTWQIFCLAKKWLCNLLILKAEVVELADTPSNPITLFILCKLLILNLLPFTSITSSDLPRRGQ